jgi:hypothetical protein
MDRHPEIKVGVDSETRNSHPARATFCSLLLSRMSNAAKQTKALHLGQERGVTLQPPLVADEHDAAATLRRAVHRELEEERGLPADLAPKQGHRMIRGGTKVYGCSVSIPAQRVPKRASLSRAR